MNKKRVPFIQHETLARGVQDCKLSPALAHEQASRNQSSLYSKPGGQPPVLTEDAFQEADGRFRGRPSNNTTSQNRYANLKEQNLEFVAPKIMYNKKASKTAIQRAKQQHNENVRIMTNLMGVLNRQPRLESGRSSCSQLSSGRGPPNTANNASVGIKTTLVSQKKTAPKAALTSKGQGEQRVSFNNHLTQPDLDLKNEKELIDQVNNPKWSDFKSQKTKISKGRRSQMEREEKKKIDRENFYLYSKIVKINESPQYGYLGLHKRGSLTHAEKALEAGVMQGVIRKEVKSTLTKQGLFEAQTGQRSILERDRLLHGKGGHSQHCRTMKNKAIDAENAKILDNLKRQKATIDFRKFEVEARQKDKRISSISFFPSIDKRHSDRRKLTQSVMEAGYLAGGEAVRNLKVQPNVHSIFTSGRNSVAEVRKESLGSAEKLGFQSFASSNKPSPSKCQEKPELSKQELKMLQLKASYDRQKLTFKQIASIAKHRTSTDSADPRRETDESQIITMNSQPDQPDSFRNSQHPSNFMNEFTKNKQVFASQNLIPTAKDGLAHLDESIQNHREPDSAGLGKSSIVDEVRANVDDVADFSRLGDIPIFAIDGGPSEAGLPGISELGEMSARVIVPSQAQVYPDQALKGPLNLQLKMRASARKESAFRKAMKSNRTSAAPSMQNLPPKRDTEEAVESSQAILEQSLNSISSLLCRGDKALVKAKKKASNLTSSLLFCSSANGQDLSTGLPKEPSRKKTGSIASGTQSRQLSKKAALTNQDYFFDQALGDLAGKEFEVSDYLENTKVAQRKTTYNGRGFLSSSTSNWKRDKAVVKQALSQRRKFERTRFSSTSSFKEAPPLVDESLAKKKTVVKDSKEPEADTPAKKQVNRILKFSITNEEGDSPSSLEGKIVLRPNQNERARKTTSKMDKTTMIKVNMGKKGQILGTQAKMIKSNASNYSTYAHTGTDPNKSKLNTSTENSPLLPKKKKSTARKEAPVLKSPDRSPNTQKIFNQANRRIFDQARQIDEPKEIQMGQKILANTETSNYEDAIELMDQFQIQPSSLFPMEEAKQATSSGEFVPQSFRSSSQPGPDRGVQTRQEEQGQDSGVHSTINQCESGPMQTQTTILEGGHNISGSVLSMGQPTIASPRQSRRSAMNSTISVGRQLSDVGALVTLNSRDNDAQSLIGNQSSENQGSQGSQENFRDFAGRAASEQEILAEEAAINEQEFEETTVVASSIIEQRSDD